MTAGVRVWDGNGNILLDISTRAGRFVGEFTTPGGTQSGSFTDSDLVGKDQFFYYHQPSSSEYGGPVVTANLSTGLVSWEYEMTISGSTSTPPYPSETIVYGAF